MHEINDYPIILLHGVVTRLGVIKILYILGIIDLNELFLYYYDSSSI